MNILSRYIFRKCFANTCMVIFAFAVLYAIVNSISSIGDVGKGDFNTFALFVYTIVLLPNMIYQLIPLSVLIGVMTAMLSLVNYSEYAIIRTSGVSLKRITSILLMVGISFAIITFFIGEIVAPAANTFAGEYKLTKTKQVVTTQLNSGIWSKDGDNNIVNIKQVMPDNTISNVSIFKYNNDLELQQLITAVKGNFNTKTNLWELSNAKILNYTAQNIIESNVTNYIWKTSIEPSYFNILVIPPEDMSAISLIKYMKHLELNNQSTQRYQIAFWNKLLYPIAAISMALIALAFIPNNRRSINLSTKLFVGIIIGLSFFFLTKLVGFMALLFSWNPIISSTAPTLGLFLIGWYVILRKE